MSQSAIPGRHGCDMHNSRRQVRALRRLIRGCDPEPNAQQWQALGEGLLQGDPLADALVAWMHTAGMANARPLFETALNDGIAALPDAPEPLRQFFTQVETQPAWVNPELMAEGTRVCQITGMTGMRALRSFGLMAGYQAAAINRTLVLTGGLKGGVQRRLAETTKWWIDCTRANGMARFSPGFKTTVHVRMVHALIRRNVQRMPEWDADFYGLPVNQTDMAATYLGFSVVFLLGSRLLGVPITRREGHAVMHLWKYICWLMGVDERWLVEAEMQGRVALYQNILSQAPPDESSREMGQALMNEPLQRHYRWPVKLRARLERARHLSIDRTYLGAQAAQALGLPRFVLPWYPLLSVPSLLAWHQLHRGLPSGRERLIQLGEREQAGYLPTLFGARTPTVRGLEL